MKRISRLLAIFCILILTQGMTSAQDGKADHELWDKVLKTYVNAEGLVNYKDLDKSRSDLDKYLLHVSTRVPENTWTDDEKLVYWINVYNAFTVSLILDHYPLKSIMDIKDAWDKKFIQLGKKAYSLNQIEHEIIRKEFSEPRIHFALVCAAISCPILLNTAYNPADLEFQLHQQTVLFINDKSKNRISESIGSLSEIFNWFQDDFTKKGTLVEFLNLYSQTKLDPKAKISFMDYDWSLNGQN